jgi:hypothetical protein
VAAPNDPTPGIKLVTLYELRQDWNDAGAVAESSSSNFRRTLTPISRSHSPTGSGDTGAQYRGQARLPAGSNSKSVLSRYVALLNSAKEYREVRSVLQDAVARYPRDAPLKGDLIRVEAAIDGLDSAPPKRTHLRRTSRTTAFTI